MLAIFTFASSQPIPAPVPVPDVPVVMVCMDGGVTYRPGVKLIRRTTRNKEAADTLAMQGKGWVLELVEKVQKNNVDCTYRCVGKPTA